MKILIILLSLLFLSCSPLQSASSKNIKTYYKNGNIQNDISMKNDKRNGPMTSYFANGKIAVEGFFTDDERDKKWTFYDETTGNITAIENYRAGLLQGQQLYYYPDGTLRMKGSYKDDERIGFWHLYRPDGSLEIQNIFLNVLRFR